jgi:hypothetical protein
VRVTLALRGRAHGSPDGSCAAPAPRAAAVARACGDVETLDPLSGASLGLVGRRAARGPRAAAATRRR